MKKLFPQHPAIHYSLKKIAYDYTDKYGNWPNFYVVASDGACKSEPFKIKIPYQHTGLSIGYNEVYFCEGGEDFKEAKVYVGGEEHDYTLYFYDQDNNILEPSTVTYEEKGFTGANVGSYCYSLMVSNDPAKRYYSKIDISNNRCVSGNYKHEFKRYMTASQQLSIDVASPNVKSATDGYIACEGDEVTLSVRDGNISQFSMYEIATGEKKDNKFGWLWECRTERGGDFVHVFLESEKSITYLISSSLEFRAIGLYQFGCPIVESNIISISPEEKPEFSLAYDPDCNNKEIELSIVSEETYDPSQITAIANSKPISFVDNKATTSFTEDTKFEVSIEGKVCSAVTKDITAEYDCVAPEFSLETDKDTVCEGSEVELSLVASGDYDASKVSATANGKPITLTADGKYSTNLEETTKFEVVIENADGTKTTLEKTVEVEQSRTSFLMQSQIAQQRRLSCF